jgi:predicted amidohydrolase
VPESKRKSGRTFGGVVTTYAPNHICLRTPVAVEYEMLEGRPAGISLADALIGGLLRVEPLDTELSSRTLVEAFEVTGDRSDCESKLRKCIRRAARDRVSVLVLPELSVTPGVLESVRTEIGGDFPSIIVAGLGHHKIDDQYVNKAIIVSKDGSVIHEQLKLTRVNGDAGWEVHQTGNQLTLSPSPWGLIATPICKDLFGPISQQSIAASGATLLLVPSLSPKTDDHETAAKLFRLKNLATTAVSNRWGISGQEMHPALGRSFVLVPGRRPEFVRSRGKLDIRWGTLLRSGITQVS